MHLKDIGREDEKWIGRAQNDSPMVGFCENEKSDLYYNTETVSGPDSKSTRWPICQ